jgi:hypothetical protein
LLCHGKQSKANLNMATQFGHSYFVPIDRRIPVQKKVPLGVTLIVGLVFSLLMWAVAITGAIWAVRWLTEGLG